MLKLVWMDTLLYSYTMEYYSAIKMNKWVIHTIRMSLKSIMLVKEARLKRTNIYASIYMTFWKRQNYGDGKQTTSSQWLEFDLKGWLHRGSRKYFGGWWNCFIFWLSKSTVCQKRVYFYSMQICISIKSKKSKQFIAHKLQTIFIGLVPFAGANAGSWGQKDK